MATETMTGIVGLCGVLLGFGCACLLSVSIVARLRRLSARALSQGGAKRRGTKEAVVQGVAHNGIPPFRRLVKAFMSMARIKDFLEGLSEWLKVRWGLVCPAESAGSLLLAALLAVGLAASLVAWNPVGGVAADALVVALIATRISAWRESELEALRDGVPLALNVMGDCFQSGYSLLQTMQQVAEQSEGRLAALFARCANVMQIGGTSREALDCLREEKGVAELSFVAVALDVQHQTGGSVAAVLSNAQSMVADEIELRRSLQVQTAQARLSARVVCMMPFVLVAVLSLLSEGFLSAFFESAAGVVMLVVALAMQASGVLLVRRMLKVA